MGNFLSDIKGHEVSVDEELLNSSHSKLVEYYSSYKSICEGYTINVPEYTHIFGQQSAEYLQSHFYPIFQITEAMILCSNKIAQPYGG